MLTAQMKSKTTSISMTVIVWFALDEMLLLKTEYDGDGGVYIPVTIQPLLPGRRFNKLICLVTPDRRLRCSDTVRHRDGRGVFIAPCVIFLSRLHEKMTPSDLSLIHDYRREDCTSLIGVLFTSEQEFTSPTLRDKTMTSTISRGVLGQATGHSLHRLTI